MLTPVRATHAAFLRAINIGGRRLTMQQLVAALAPLGFEGVDTWQATGNVVFAAGDGADSADLERRISEVLQDGLGMAVPAIVRTADRVAAIATDVPFTVAQVERTEGRVQVLFVRDQPGPEAVAAVLEHSTDDDELVWRCRELWWLPRTGVSDSRLSVRALEDALGVTTMRSHRSVAGLLARHLSP